MGARGVAVRNPRSAQGVQRLDRSLLVLGVLTVLAAALRFSTLDLQSYWYDETVMTIDTLKPGIVETLRALPNSDATPPLYPVAAWLWSRVFGEGEVGLRSLSALAGTATAPVMYAAAATYFTRRTALVAAALVAFHPLLVWYSQEARPYAVLTLLTAVSLVFLGRALQEPSRRRLSLWAATAALLLWTHYFAAYLVIGEAAWLLVAAGAAARRKVAVAVGACGAAGLLFLPLALAQRTPTAVDWIARIPLSERLREMPEKYLAGWPTPGTYDSVWLYTLPLVALAILLLVARAEPRERGQGTALLALAGVGLAIPLLLALGGLDYFHHRHLMAALMPMLLALAAGFGTAHAGKVGVAAAVALCAAFLALDVGVWVEPTRQREDWRAALEQLPAAAGTRLIVPSPGYAFEPLEQYGHPVRPLSGHRARVSELVLVGSAVPELPPRKGPLRGFRLVERRDFDTLALLRVRASRRRSLGAGEVARALGVGRRDVWLETAR